MIAELALRLASVGPATHAEKAHRLGGEQLTPARSEMAINNLPHLGSRHHHCRRQAAWLRPAGDVAIELEQRVDGHELGAEDVALAGAPLAHSKNVALDDVACGHEFEPAGNICAQPT